jgi:MT0933-like antitoxin protein
MGLFDEVKKKATEFAEKNPDKLESISDQVISKAGDAADAATHGKFTSQIDGVQEKADGAVGE